ncbi:MAG: hypothetical protein K1Y02_18195 [Candidatus Hydrogenedentes bacterium]|nr:hypothetical protein [Candidatus Hydrogenedentota bacterium]
MNRDEKRRLSIRKLTLLLVSLAFVVTGVVLSFWAWQRQFAGTLQVSSGKEERYAWRTSNYPGSKRLVGNLGLSMSKDDVLSLCQSVNSTQVFSNELYDIAELPFSVKLDRAKEIESKKVAGRLGVMVRNKDVKAYGGHQFAGGRAMEAVPGTKFEVGPEDGEILEVRPWSGIVSAPGGEPMAEVFYLDASEHGQRVVLTGDSCHIFDSETAVYFAWRSTREEALAAVQAGAAQLPQARWGIDDGKEVTWIESLLPGSGVELENGVYAMLVSVPKVQPGEAPSIVVETVREGKKQRRQLRAGESDDLIRFEDPLGRPRVFALFGWGQNRAEALYLENGVPVGTYSLGAQNWCPKPGGPSIRIGEALEGGAYASPGSTSSYEVGIRVGDREFYVREGETYNSGDGVFEFDAEVTPAVYDYDLTVTRDGTRQTKSVRSGGTLTEAGWELTVSRSESSTADAVSVEVVNVAMRNLLFLGAGLAVLGCVCLIAVAARAGARR